MPDISWQYDLAGILGVMENLHWLMPWLPLTMTAPKTPDGMNFDLPPQGDKPEAEVVKQLTNQPKETTR